METGESGESGVIAVRHVEEENIQGRVNVTTLLLLTVEKTVLGHSGRDDFVIRMIAQVKVLTIKIF